MSLPADTIVPFLDYESGRPIKNPGVAVITCVDPRLSKAPYMTDPAGDAYVRRSIAADVPARGVRDDDFDAFLELLLLKSKGIKTLAIVGHSDCRGIHHMADRFIREITGEDGKRPQAALDCWLMPDSDKDIWDEIKRRGQGVPREEMSKALEQLKPLISARRLLEREIKDGEQVVTVGQLLREKGITLVPAVYNLGEKSLYAFDFDAGHYRSAKQLAREATRPEGAVVFRPNPSVQAVAYMPALLTHTIAQKLAELGTGHGADVSLK